MFKEFKKENGQCVDSKILGAKVNFSQKGSNNLLEIIVGSSNVKRWNKLKRAFLCTSNEEFVTKLLDIAQKYQQSNLGKEVLNKTFSETILNGNCTPITSENNTMVESKKKNSKKSVVEVKLNRNKENKPKTDSKENSIEAVCENSSFSDFNNLLCDFAEQNINSTKPNDLISLQTNTVVGPTLPNKTFEIECYKNDSAIDENVKRKRKTVNGNNGAVIEANNGSMSKNRDRKKINKKKKNPPLYDVRKAPELQEQVEEVAAKSEPLVAPVVSKPELKIEDVSKKNKKSKLCVNCDTNHLKYQCPIEEPVSIICDKISKDDWKMKYLSDNDDQEDEYYNVANKDLLDDVMESTYSNMSLPSVLNLMDSNTSHGMSIFAKSDIKQFTQFGPLVAKSVKEVDIPEDFPMKELWMIFSKDSYTYWRTDYLNETNWFRYLRPAPTREQRNATVLCKSNLLFLITIKTIVRREEILYWQDDNLNLNKKKLGKTNCGGCNMVFSHSLYYRTHCTIFHDIRYSLTIRKFHCKVCGVAVLGKENIMKHAAELHNGQGAYQCQFCKKFFLRLNYLDMHRTYGCSANPHRTWPLCDFCGKKFCQPQKLKIHIKRMHNDITEVLKEFQCKSCLKVLGSRAAVQRHLKEVHNKQVEGSSACYRCGKLFQNKSNLKIHMLTHSGIKPFRCREERCIAAFTTKQCLQFHYKKSHGFTEDSMPKIERSVDYTFEAYSGMENAEGDNKDLVTTPENSFDCDNDDNEENDDGIDDQNVDDPGDIDLEASLHNEPVPQLIQTPPPPPQPESLFTMKILSKGSKKWLGDQLDPLTTSNLDNNLINKVTEKPPFAPCSSTPQPFDVAKTSLSLNTFGRHESSNASLLVEAALGSVADINCTDSNIDIDVSGTPNSTDALVSNICTLSHTDELPDVSYNDVNEHRNISLISPSVNENISVTDDLNTDLHNDENMGIDYSSFQEGDFSSNNSPENEEHPEFHCDYTNENREDHSKNNLSPGSSPPRYNFGNEVTICHVSPTDPNCLTAQNLSVHDSKGELDLSIYKSSYGLETSNFHLRKDLKMKLALEPTDHKQLYVLEVEDISRNLSGKSIFSEENKYGLFSSDSVQVDVVESRDSENKAVNENNSDEKYNSNSDLDLSFRSKYSDSDLETRSKQFEFDLNFRSKSYDLATDLLQIRSSYENNLDLDFRNKNYPTIDNVDIRNKTTYDNIESELRVDRNFDSLVFTPTDLQGIDMTARSFHNYHASSAAASLNRYHHLYPDVERASIDLRVNYSPPPPTYSHSDVLRVVSLDLTSPGRHTVDLSLRSNPLHAHQLPNARLLAEHNLPSSRLLTDPGRLTLDQNRLLTADLSSSRHLETHSRLLNVSETNNRVLSDHSTNRLLSNDQNDHFGTTDSGGRIMADDTRYINDQNRLIESGRLLSDVRILPTVPNGSLSPIPYPNYSVSPTPYHPPVLTARPHVSSPTPSPYHHYSSYY